MKVKFKIGDYLLEICGGILFLYLVFLPFYYYNELPALLPKHFNALGEADAFGNKDQIWFLPTIGIILYLGVSILTRYPGMFNFPVEVNAENRERLYTIATKSLRLLKVVMISAFTYLTHQTIQIALQNDIGLGQWFIFAFVISIIVVQSIMLFSMFKTQK